MATGTTKKQTKLEAAEATIEAWRKIADQFSSLPQIKQTRKMVDEVAIQGKIAHIKATQEVYSYLTSYPGRDRRIPTNALKALVIKYPCPNVSKMPARLFDAFGHHPVEVAIQAWNTDS